MITIYITLMSGEVIPYTCIGREGKAKYLTHKDRIKKMVFNHLNLNIDNYIVKLFHDDDEDKLQEEHKERVEKWLRSGKPVTKDTYILHENYDSASIRIFEEQRDKNRYYEDGSVVRAFVNEFNFRKAWNNLKNDR